MSLFGLMGTARSGITAASAALQTTGNNVANVATPGYARRTAVLETATAGGGVRYAQTVRTVDRFAQAHVVDQKAKQGAARARSDALAELEATIAPPDGSFGDKALALVKAFNALTAFPIDPALRADVLAKTENLAAALRSTAASINAQSESLLGRAGDVTVEVNANLKRIADLNKQIAIAQASGGDAGALRDQRDQVINGVGERLGAKAIEDENGQVTLFAAGAVLVSGNDASQLSIDLDPSTGAMRFYAQPKGGTKQEITARVDTGTLGGLREARDTDLAKTMANLDSYAFDVANAFNAVHEKGVGLDGAGDRALFAVSGAEKGAAASLSLNPDLAGHPERIGASDAAGNLPGGNVVALELAGLSDTHAFGGATLPDRYAAMATDIGFRKAGADAEVQLRTDTLAVAQALSDSANGVSLDEEMVNLTQYQRAFEAASRVMRTADELLQTLLNAI
ncbi:MAG: flagellar hook-associated protein FlgK [Labilithrix sp.]|nr:flagellar hook-associated protein FlgK [Labilithrix sp.]MCW5817648.1 flagellar hook-associated protein FlgK [Labilithrix sp.]